MNKALVFYKNIMAGTLEKTGDEKFIFSYDGKYLNSNIALLGHYYR
jgi:hypothetical protein